jgi:hypothetical protein
MARLIYETHAVVFESGSRFRTDEPFLSHLIEPLTELARKRGVTLDGLESFRLTAEMWDCKSRALMNAEILALKLSDEEAAELFKNIATARAWLRTLG